METHTTYTCTHFSHSDATVSLQTIADTTEGGMVMVCVDITGVPAGGSECDVVVSLSTQDGPKASRFILIMIVLHCVTCLILNR